MRFEVQQWWKAPWLLPMGLYVFGLVVNLATPPTVLVGAAFSAAPLVAAALWTFRGTVVVAVLSAATRIAVLASSRRFVDSANEWLRLITITTVAALSLFIHRTLAAREARIASFRTLAETVQQAIQPSLPEHVGPYVFACRYEAAHSDARVGGDMFGSQRTPVRRTADGRRRARQGPAGDQPGLHGPGRLP